MATITQKIQQFPDAPNSQTDTPIEFNAKADAFVHHQADTYVTEVNTWATQANALEGTMNQIKTDIDNIAAAIPAGTINDIGWATDKVWSSTKVHDQLGLKQDKDPDHGIVVGGRGGDFGFFIKFPDGTLICYGNRTSLPHFAIDTAKGSMFISINITQPMEATFVGDYTITAEVRHPGTTAVVGVNIDDVSTQVSFDFRFWASMSVSPTITASWLAIGKWK